MIAYAPSPDRCLVAVYGTLKDNQGNHELIGKSRFINSGTTKAPLVMKSAGGFPVVFQKPGANVSVEVYECDETTMKRLDALEGNGVMFQRELTEIEFLDGSVFSCWMYYGVNKYWGRHIDNMPLVSKDNFGQFSW